MSGPRLCPACETRAGINTMKRNVTQEYDHATETPEIINWVCPFCGHSEVETNYYQATGGTYNSGVVQGPLA